MAVDSPRSLDEIRKSIESMFVCVFVCVCAACVCVWVCVCAFLHHAHMQVLS